ncbi:MAG: GHMP family kinase ATP-binding protein [Anaerolineae bacterium]
MQISATVPMRVDLAGGTLDVYPLYLFEGGGLTLNAAVSINASVRLNTRTDRRITIASADLHQRQEVSSLEALEPGGPLALVHYALKYYQPECGLDISIASEAPAGSGLGASSALLMALSASLCELTGRPADFQRIIDVGANIEAQVVGIPTGKQDYFPPLYGGLCSIWFGIDGWQLDRMPEAHDLVNTLNERLIVSYTGIPHSSAVTNWAMLKGYIEKQGDTVERIHEIKAIAEEMRGALARVDIERFYALVDREWQLRRGLAEGVSTPRIDSIIAAARQAGAAASKICGAGGGGCMITLAEPTVAPQVRQALARAGAQVLPATLVSTGLQIQVTR